MGVDLGYMVLIALGALKLTELYKELYRRFMGNRQVAWIKSVVNLGCCAALTLLVLGRGWRIQVLIALGAAGLSALLHALDTVLRSHRDDMVASVFNRQNARRH
jgi:hypothetical protein